jgi:signal transduction histidine kinase/CheY-like chemotaxis protein
MSGDGALTRERHVRLSVRWKLMVVALITTAIALVVSSATLLMHEFHVYRTGLISDLSSEANILALSTGPALAFDDHRTADRNVKALEARPAVLVAAIYGANGHLYASYVRPDAMAPPALLPRVPGGGRVSGRRIEITQSVEQNGERLGTIYVRGRYDVAGQVDAFLGVTGLVGLLSLGVALALSTLLQRSITRRLSAIGDIAQQVIRERDYSRRAPAGGEDEIGLLVAAFNNMLDEVQSRTHELIQSETALKEADRRKDEFLAILAHELRNPLAPIRHAVNLLELPTLDERRRAWSREVIGRQVQRMALLLDDLLDVSRITRNKLQLKISRVELSALVRSAVEVARPLIETKGQELRIQLSLGPTELEVDPLRLSQALSNLLTNAAKYTDAGGTIELHAQLTDSELLFTVRDTGIGLAAEAIPNLFGMFSQVQGASNRGEGGLGIGLALVRGLITLHGGSVEAQSEGPGRGSTFTIHLPRSVVLTPRADKPSERNPSRKANGAPCSVLIADDNRDAADTLALLLTAVGYDTCVAHSGREALDLARHKQPEVLILDIGMPDMTGHELARLVRTEAWGSRALLIAATGWGQKEDKVRAAAAGFDHHLTKPVAPEALQGLLAEFTERLEMRRSMPPGHGRS